MEFTVIVGDMTQHHVGMQVIPAWEAVQVEADHPQAAASEAEVVVATKIWERRYPDRPGPWEEHSQDADDDWIECMESVGVPVVIEGHNKTYIEDEIYA